MQRNQIKGRRKYGSGILVSSWENQCVLVPGAVSASNRLEPSRNMCDLFNFREVVYSFF